MGQSLSWEANRFLASPEILRILWNPKVYKSIPPVPILSQINPVCAPHPTSWRSILILFSYQRLGLPSGLLPSGFPTKTLCALLPHTCYMSRPSHCFQFDHPNNIRWGVQIIRLYISFSPLPCYFVPLRPKYYPQHPILKHPQPTFLPQSARSSFTPIQNNRQN